MDMLEIISKKRDGIELSADEIRFFIEKYTAGDIPDYQASALLMAIYFRKLSDAETYELTSAMMKSGDIIDLSRIKGIKADKHSTGGVGDKTTLVVAPIAAAAGIPIAKMSGRGLGFTGGTIDKLESIPGFRTELTEEEFFHQIEEIGIAVIGQTATVAKADKKLYALRDVTGTVADRSLIASSIMSKKLACGADAIVLDVKCGNGAFLKTYEEAVDLAGLMIDIGKNVAGKRVNAVVSDMNQPLGLSVGNSLEVIEAIETLKGSGPEDLTGLCLALASAMILAGEKAASLEEARKIAEAKIRDGSALSVLRAMIVSQGGDGRVIDNYLLFQKASFKRILHAPSSGYVCEINTEEIGKASQHAGAGRMRKEDDIDFGAGIVVAKKLGDYVEEGEALLTIYAGDESKLDAAMGFAARAYKIGSEKPDLPPLVKALMGIEDNYVKHIGEQII